MWDPRASESTYEVDDLFDGPYVYEGGGDDETKQEVKADVERKIHQRLEETGRVDQKQKISEALWSMPTDVFDQVILKHLSGGDQKAAFQSNRLWIQSAREFRPTEYLLDAKTLTDWFLTGKATENALQYVRKTVGVNVRQLSINLTPTTGAFRHAKRLLDCFPKLETLSVSWMGNTSDADPYADFAYAALCQLPQLKNVHLYVDRPLPGKIINYLLARLSDGNEQPAKFESIEFAGHALDMHLDEIALQVMRFVLNPEVRRFRADHMLLTRDCVAALPSRERLVALDVDSKFEPAPWEPGQWAVIWAEHKRQWTRLCVPLRFNAADIDSVSGGKSFTAFGVRAASNDADVWPALVRLMARSPSLTTLKVVTDTPENKTVDEELHAAARRYCPLLTTISISRGE